MIVIAAWLAAVIAGLAALYAVVRFRRRNRRDPAMFVPSTHMRFNKDE